MSDTEPKTPRDWKRARRGSIVIPGDNKSEKVQKNHKANCLRILQVATSGAVTIVDEQNETDGGTYVLSPSSMLPLHHANILKAVSQSGSEWHVEDQSVMLPDPEVPSLKKLQRTMVIVCDAKAAERFSRWLYFSVKLFCVGMATVGFAGLCWMSSIQFPS